MDICVKFTLKKKYISNINITTHGYNSSVLSLIYSFKTNLYIHNIHSMLLYVFDIWGLAKSIDIGSFLFKARTVIVYTHIS